MLEINIHAHILTSGYIFIYFWMVSLLVDLFHDNQWFRPQVQYAFIESHVESGIYMILGTIVVSIFMAIMTALSLINTLLKLLVISNSIYYDMLLFEWAIEQNIYQIAKKQVFSKDFEKLKNYEEIILLQTPPKGLKIKKNYKNTFKIY